MWHSSGTYTNDGDEDGYIVLSLQLKAEEEISDDEILEIDCMGLGNTTMPYAILSGTSFSAPLVSAAAAICSTGIDQSLAPSERAQKTAEAVKGCTTQYDQFKGKCTTGGTLDLSKLGEGAAANPVVSNAVLNEADQCILNITGANFGTQQGSVTVDGTAAKIISWGDCAISVRVPAGTISGTASVEVSSAAGSCSKLVDLEFTQNPSADDLSLYEETIQISNNELRSTTGTATLVGLDDCIYVFAQSVDSATYGDYIRAYQKLYRYDISSGLWDDLGELPAYTDKTSGGQICGFQSVNATLWDGKIIMLGRGGLKDALTQKLFSFDPATGTWTELSDIEDSIPLGAAIVNAGETMVAIGGTVDTAAAEAGTESSDSSNNVWVIDMQSGERTLAGSLANARSNTTSYYGQPMQVAASGDTIYVYAGVKMMEGSPLSKNPAVERLVKQEDGTYEATLLDDYLPAMQSEYDVSYGLTAGTNGAAFCGVKATQVNNDTFLLDNSDTSPTSLGKKASHIALAGMAALAYHDKLYAFGIDEFNGGFAVMRATAFDTPEHPAGEHAKTEPDPSPEPEPAPQPEPSPTPQPSNDTTPANDNGSASQDALASTGDATPIAAALASVALAGATCLFARARRKQR